MSPNCSYFLVDVCLELYLEVTCNVIVNEDDDKERQ